jgi:RHS repeat-associated protein
MPHGVTSAFRHNTLDQLTGYTIPNQTAATVYDAAGNRTTHTVNGTPRTLTYNVANRLTNDGGLAVTHDANGSVTQYGSASLTWDVRGRLVQVVDGATVTSFGYDCFNRRVSKTVNGVTKRYLWLGDDLAAEGDANWNVTASYFFEPGVDQPISRTDGSGTVYYLADHAGSVTALARPDGTLIGRYSYTPWGEYSADAGMPAQPLLWTGRELDETGLYYLRGRYYNPANGRFLSEDPAGLEANLNLYLFALDSPIGQRDPFGLWNTSLSDGGGGGGGARSDPLRNFVAGMGDVLTFGTLPTVRRGIGTLLGIGDPNDMVGFDSDAYRYGQYAGLADAAGITVGAGALWLGYRVTAAGACGLPGLASIRFK